MTAQPPSTVLVGTGGYGLRHLRSLLDLHREGRIDLVGLVDVAVAEASSRLVSEYACSPTWHPSLADALSAAPVDSVVIATPRTTAVDRDLEAWLEDNVSFVDTVADRITPATTGADVALVARTTGRPDRAPVVTEPFAEWILAGEFPAGRPEWERAGALVVDDIGPFERRKLRLLNGAHLLLALAGLPRGHHTVAEAIADPALSRLAEDYWSSAAPGVPDAGAYRRQLRTRFVNARIRRPLAQIATDAEAKLRERVVPLVTELLAGGADPTPAMRVVAAWLAQAGLGHTALDRLAPGWAAERHLRRSLHQAALDLPD